MPGTRFFSVLLLTFALVSLASAGPGAARMPAGEQKPPEPAEITVVAPEEAELWFNDYRSKQIGSVRSFVTPPLSAGQQYHYRLQARWPGGEWTYKLTIQAGEHRQVVVPTETPLEPLAQPDSLLIPGE